MSIASTDTEIEYPDSDGQPIAENTLQFEWITRLHGNLEVIFGNDPDVFVAADLLWYPVEGNNQLRIAPDAMVVFGRPKGHRGSYLQWREDGIAPQVVFEVLSPGNRLSEMIRKFQHYEELGVEEYYVIDPDRLKLEGWIRSDDELRAIDEMNGWTSPRLSIRFERRSDDIVIYRPDGSRFLTFSELNAATQREREVARLEAERADAESVRADAEAERADAESVRADAEAARAERLAARLRELGENPD
ncbi:MAG: Uma2 family endonuclease [Planctomycetaceae bacterium]